MINSRFFAFSPGLMKQVVYQRDKADDLFSDCGKPIGFSSIIWSRCKIFAEYEENDSP
jgi:hypothetical protein